ncbi:MAG: hypothetical protein KDA83_22115, partial [Planctomycetales bacterium]|nr:hypothetical protein [Planctomycetales bacterium]
MKVSFVANPHLRRRDCYFRFFPDEYCCKPGGNERWSISKPPHFAAPVHGLVTRSVDRLKFCALSATEVSIGATLKYVVYSVINGLR